MTRIDAGVQAVYSGLKNIEYVNVQVESDIECFGEISVSEVKIFKLFEAPISLSGIATIDLEFYMMLSVDGSISIKADVPLQATIHYEKGSGLRTSSGQKKGIEPSIQAYCKAECKFRMEPILKILVWNIIDAEFDIGVSINAELIECY